jgi:hypothetical protein
MVYYSYAYNINNVIKHICINLNYCEKNCKLIQPRFQTQHRLFNLYFYMQFIEIKSVAFETVRILQGHAIKCIYYKE